MYLEVHRVAPTIQSFRKNGDCVAVLVDLTRATANDALFYINRIGAKFPRIPLLALHEPSDESEICKLRGFLFGPLAHRFCAVGTAADIHQSFFISFARSNGYWIWSVCRSSGEVLNFL